MIISWAIVEAALADYLSIHFKGEGPNFDITRALMIKLYLKYDTRCDILLTVEEELLLLSRGHLRLGIDSFDLGVPRNEGNSSTTAELESGLQRDCY